MPPIDAAGSMAPATWGRKPARFIKRNGESPGGDGVGDRAARHRAEERRGDDGDLGRAAGRLARQRHRDVDEELAGARLLQEGAEEDEEDDVGGEHARHHPEDAVGGDEQRGAQALDAEAAMGDDLREVGAEVGVGEQAHADHGHRPAEHPPAHLQRQQNADDADQSVELVLGAGAEVQVLELVDPVVDGAGGGEREQHVRRRRVARPSRHRTAVGNEDRHRRRERYHQEWPEPGGAPGGGGHSAVGPGLADLSHARVERRRAPVEPDAADSREDRAENRHQAGAHRRSCRRDRAGRPGRR